MYRNSYKLYYCIYCPFDNMIYKMIYKKIKKLNDYIKNKKTLI